jgi:hypothetical protein
MRVAAKRRAQRQGWFAVLLRPKRAGGSDLKAFDPLREEVDRFLRGTEIVLVVVRLA